MFLNVSLQVVYNFVLLISFPLYMMELKLPWYAKYLDPLLESWRRLADQTSVPHPLGSPRPGFGWSYWHPSPPTTVQHGGDHSLQLRKQKGIIIFQVVIKMFWHIYIPFFSIYNFSKLFSLKFGHKLWVFLSYSNIHSVKLYISTA